MVLHERLFTNWRSQHSDYHLRYTPKLVSQQQATVKFHGVFASHWSSLVSAPGGNFQGYPARDSVDLVTPFMQATNQVARYFATLRELLLLPPFTRSWLP